MYNRYSILTFGMICFLSVSIFIQCKLDQKLDVQYDPSVIYPADTTIAVILTPAGSNVDFNYDALTHKLSALQDTLTFLPFPANFGFIHQNIGLDQQPNTPIQCIVVGKQLESLMPVGIRTIGVVEVEEKEGTNKSYVVCVPEDPNLRMANISNFADLITKHDAVKFQIQHFLLNYKGLNQTKIIGWNDEEYAKTLILNNLNKHE